MAKALKLRVVLDHEDEVFRDILIPAHHSFEQLHHTILQAFGYPNNEMASFFMSNENWDKGEELPLVDMNMQESKGGMTTMRDVKLGERLTEKNRYMVYVYDFFYMWCFFVKLMSVTETDEEDPQLLTIFGKAPDPESKDTDFTFDSEDLNGDDPKDLM